MIPRCTQTPVAFQNTASPAGGTPVRAVRATRVQPEFGWFWQKKKDGDSLEAQVETLGPKAWKSFKWAVLSGGVGIISGIAGFFFPPIWVVTALSGLAALYNGYKLVSAFPAKVLQGKGLQEASLHLSRDPKRQQEICKELLQDLETLYQPSSPDKKENKNLVEENKKRAYAYSLQWGLLLTPFMGARMLSPFQQDDHQLKVPISGLEMALIPPIKNAISKEIAETLRKYPDKSEVSLPEAYTIARQWMKAWVANLPKK